MSDFLTHLRHQRDNTIDQAVRAGFMEVYGSPQRARAAMTTTLFTRLLEGKERHAINRWWWWSLYVWKARTS
jgi:hypothetical protein